MWSQSEMRLIEKRRNKHEGPICCGSCPRECHCQPFATRDLTNLHPLHEVERQDLLSGGSQALLCASATVGPGDSMLDHLRRLGEKKVAKVYVEQFSALDSHGFGLPTNFFVFKDFSIHGAPDLTHVHLLTHMLFLFSHPSLSLFIHALAFLPTRHELPLTPHSPALTLRRNVWTASYWFSPSITCFASCLISS